MKAECSNDSGLAAVPHRSIGTSIRYRAQKLIRCHPRSLHASSSTAQSQSLGWVSRESCKPEVDHGRAAPFSAANSQRNVDRMRFGDRRSKWCLNAMLKEQVSK